MINLFDSHAHYNDEKFDLDREDMINTLYNNNITKIINAGYNIDSSKKAVELANKYNFIYATCGISPNDIDDYQEQSIEKISKLATNKKVVAIGEIGLDYYWNKENLDLQKEIFIKQIEIANELDLPIVIHTREAIYDTLDILKNKIQIKNKGVFHCCPLNVELVKEALKLGFYISFAGPITFKNSKNADQIIEIVPLDKMLIETDSPYLSPEPLRGKRNTSLNLKYIIEKLAQVKQIEIEEIAKLTYKNAETVFKL